MKVIRIQALDWEGLYFDGVLADEGHSLRLGNILSLLVGKTITEVVTYGIDQDYMEDLGDLPEKFSEIDSGMLFTD